MSATELAPHDAHSGEPLWRDRARQRALLRRHGLALGLALLVGALLRLLWLGDTSFLGDQAQLLAMGQSAALHHAVILTGIPSSLGSLNPPVSTWLYAPFALAGGALGATIFTALANLVAVALLYALAARYLNRMAAFSAALLYATASGPVHYARFIWQQNLLAPVVILFFWIMLRAIVERRRGWLAWATLLGGVAIELHPTAAPLLGLIALALAFTWRDLRRRDLLWTAAAIIALVGPTILWEALSHGYDLAGAARFSQGRAVIDTWALTYLLQLIQPAPAGAYGSASAYTSVGRGVAFLGVILEVALIGAQLWLIAMLAAPWARARAAMAGLRAGLADARWRFALCLALWEALPLTLMLRHTRPVEPHYVLVILPAVYLSIGAALAWAAEWLHGWLARRSQPLPNARMVVLAALVALVVLISAGQTVGVAAELGAIHSGQFDALTLPLHYGTPLASERAALAATQAAARRLGATVAIASTRVEQEPLGYLNATDASGAPAIDYISDGCLVVPSADVRHPLVTLAVPGSTAAQLLPQTQGARLIQSIPVQGGQPYQLYAIAPGASLRGETPITGANVGETQPVAAAIIQASGQPAALAIRWVGAPRLADSAASGVSYWYGADPRATTPIADGAFTAQPLDSAGQPIGAPLTATCARLAWAAGMSVITAMRLPASLPTGAQIAGWRVSAWVAPAVALRPTLGPLPLETGAITFGPPRSLGQPTTFPNP
ncbi:MAG TPA: glycosyltransferase family 39 protein [Ktedonobacterales bacterium]